MGRTTEWGEYHSPLQGVAMKGDSGDVCGFAVNVYVGANGIRPLFFASALAIAILTI